MSAEKGLALLWEEGGMVKAVREENCASVSKPVQGGFRTSHVIRSSYEPADSRQVF